MLSLRSTAVATTGAATAVVTGAEGEKMDYYIGRVGWWADGSVMVQVYCTLLLCRCAGKMRTYRCNNASTWRTSLLFEPECASGVVV
jgi:hypothetical protein